MGLLYQNNEQYYLGSDGIWNSYDENYGDYQFISIGDVINNFIVSNVGQDKLIPRLKRSDVAFHAQRGLAEMSFDVLPTAKFIEVEVGPTLFGKNPGEQQIVVGGLKSGKLNRKSWLEKERNIDVFDIKSDVIKTLIELGIEKKNL